MCAASTGRAKWSSVRGKLFPTPLRPATRIFTKATSRRCRSGRLRSRKFALSIRSIFGSRWKRVLRKSNASYRPKGAWSLASSRRSAWTSWGCHPIFSRCVHRMTSLLHLIKPVLKAYALSGPNRPHRGMSSLRRVESSGWQPGLQGKNHCERCNGDHDFRNCADDEGVEALLAHLAKIGAKPDTGEREKEAPAREVGDISGLFLGKCAKGREQRDDKKAEYEFREFFPQE